MRPEPLFSLFTSVTSLPGIGPRISQLIKMIAGENLVDLLWHLPSGLIDRRHAPKIFEVKPGAIATLTVTINQHVPPPNRRLPYKIICSDETGQISLIFFHSHKTYLKRVLPEGEIRVISGTVEKFGQDLQMSHPDHIVTLAELDSIKAVEPIYRLTQGLSLKVLSKAIQNALEKIPDFPEWQDPAYLNRQDWPTWKRAVLLIHTPELQSDLEPTSPARQRLAYDQLLANQLALRLIRGQMRRTPGRALNSTYTLLKKVENSFPFKLTHSQKVTLDEITTDMSSSLRMNRLLQGDVGSGKTIVALLGMTMAIEAGYQTAFLAPTEILAQQHFDTIKSLVEDAGIRVALYTGRDKGKNRESILDNLSSGDTQLVVGTHALFQEGVVFRDLAMAVIDEQHRFGVHQRMSLVKKGQSVDLLVMTATPIPRTLTLTTYGDMEISRLTEKPTGRLPIDTRTIPVSRLNEVITAVGRAISRETKVYWICPMIEESEVLDLAAAEERFLNLQSLFGDRVALIHGKMKGSEKDAVMKSFSKKGTDILVATTVVEVGVDVPEATVMVIEHAERFGLAQLHQLRGRIGRSSQKSSCLLLYSRNPSALARDRLETMRRTQDGFLIAERDLYLRGAGDLMGARQSGLPEYKLVDFIEHANLIQTAQTEAKLILEKDPNLMTDRGRHLRLLLYLFEQDSGVKFLKIG